jgi:ribosomal-protein-alanine N-acetyltransferase
MLYHKTMNNYDNVHAAVVQLTTARVLLRPYQEGDYPALIAIDADDAVRHQQGGDIISEERSQAWFRYIIDKAHTEQPRTHYHFAIVERATGDVIGRCALRLLDSDSYDGTLRQGDIGYVLARAAWGCGYATEAALAMIRSGFGTLGLHRITASCRAENSASAHVLEKLGMRREAYLWAGQCGGGQRIDMVQYALHADEWVQCQR